MHIWRCLRAVFFLCLVLTRAAAAQTASKFDPAVAREIEAAGQTEVFVTLAPPPSVPEQDLPARQRAIREARAAVLPSFGAADVHVHRQFSFVSAFTASVTARGLRQLLAHAAVVHVDPMQYGSGALAQSVPQIRADAVHRREDLGQGVTVAVLDTGVDVTHPDLAGSIVDEHCFCSYIADLTDPATKCCPNGGSEQSGPGSAATSAIHGIHVTGIIVSKGLVAPPGVAPGAKVVAVKVLADNNEGLLVDWIAGLDWIAANHPEVRAINMSLQSTAAFFGNCDTDPLAYGQGFAQVLEALRAHGTLTFVASGNYSLKDQMSSPACVSAAVAVGAVTKHDIVASYSNADSALDLLAPGGAVGGPGPFPEGIKSTGPAHSTAILHGTSMATPHATATAALLLAIDPTLGADALEGHLKATGALVLDTRNGLLFPRINALAAMNAVMNASRPLTGGGQRRSDCLVEWNVTPPEIATVLPYARAICHDNDPTCDSDPTPGQCMFALSACFNVPDRRLPSCSVSSPIVGYGLTAPPTDTVDAIDAANAAAIRRAMPALPITDRNVCTAPIPVVVPVGQKPSVRSIRFFAQAADGRIDFNRLRLICLPANP